MLIPIPQNPLPNPPQNPPANPPQNPPMNLPLIQIPDPNQIPQGLTPPAVPLGTTPVGSWLQLANQNIGSFSDVE